MDRASDVLLRRVPGALLVALLAVPVHRLLADPATGLAGAATARSADVLYTFAWTGTLVVGLLALLATRLLPERIAARVAGRARAVLARPSAMRFALFTGALAGLLSAAFVVLVLGGRPTHLDAFTQLLHARFIAAGMPAGPMTVDPAFWQIQNGVVTERGWVSHYPPGNVLLLAAAWLAGVPWIAGPLMVAACAYFVARCTERLMPESVAVARAGALLVACSPFLVSLGGSFMNHAPAAALLAAAAWCALRALDVAGWAVAAGAAVGTAFTVRPLTALAIGVPVLLATWLHDRAARAATLRLGARAAAGALPFLAFSAAYNAWFFGSPVRFGYDVALGPATGLGFGTDPWGNAYGPLQALAYSAADLTALGGALLETPVSPVLAGALLLALAPRLSHGERVLAVWALAPVAANALYWHHGLYMGPRMLYEAAPAWILLAAAALRRAWLRAGAAGLPLRSGLAAAGAVTIGFALWLAPQRVAGYAPAPGDVTAVRAVDVAGPSLIFVHDGWTARLAMQLAAAGMRLDSVETVLRQNPTCEVQALVDAIVAGDAGARAARLAELDLEPRAHTLPPVLTIATGSTIRIDPVVPPTPACVRQAMADRNGILDLAPLAWLGDVPGGPVRGALYVRDLGPARNAALLGQLEERTPYVLYTPADGALPVLAPYAEGMARLWEMTEPGAEAT